MKKLSITLIAISVFFTGCAGTNVKYLEPNIFMEKAGTTTGSAYTKIYIGTSQHRIYYETESVITSSGFLGLSDNPVCTIYWTYLKEIPQEFIEKLERQKDKCLPARPNIKVELSQG